MNAKDTKMLSVTLDRVAVSLNGTTYAVHADTCLPSLQDDMRAASVPVVIIGPLAPNGDCNYRECEQK